jgi:hypothetical protein
MRVCNALDHESYESSECTPGSSVVTACLSQASNAFAGYMGRTCLRPCAHLDGRAFPRFLHTFAGVRSIRWVCGSPPIFVLCWVRTPLCKTFTHLLIETATRMTTRAWDVHAPSRPETRHSSGGQRLRRPSSAGRTQRHSAGSLPRPDPESSGAAHSRLTVGCTASPGFTFTALSETHHIRKCF